MTPATEKLVSQALTQISETIGHLDDRLSAQASRLTALERGLEDLNEPIGRQECEQ